MTRGKRAQERQESLWVSHEDLPRSAGHPFYETLNGLLAAHGFDSWIQEVCQPFYAPVMGRPGLPPGVYFRCLLIGYFEGIGSERGIAWRCGDSLSLREFPGIALQEDAPDHSTLSRTRRLIDLEMHPRVFTWVLKVLAVPGLVGGKTVGIDATTLEANAALKSIVRNDTAESYEAFLTGLAKASGVATPTRADLARIDKSRKNKASNDDGHHPHDPEAGITKMKDGSTHLAHKDEQAVDMQSGAVLAVTMQPADQGDTTTWRETVEEACQNVNALIADPLTAKHVNDEAAEEIVADKGYHGNETMVDWQEIGIRSYASEPDRGPRKWAGKDQAREAVYANRRRIKGARGKRLLRRRGEWVERSFAHTRETGAMRRAHPRGRQNILKRLLIHAGGFNLGLVMRQLLGKGTPRGLAGLRAAILSLIRLPGALWEATWGRLFTHDHSNAPVVALAALFRAA